MANDLPQVMLPGTGVQRLTAARSDHEYEIHIALPSGYAESGKTYPVLYLLDPHLVFGMSTEITRLLTRGDELPELLLVGVGFGGDEKDIESYQARDYVPPRPVEPGASHGAAEFLHFIAAELIPYVEAQYRVESDDRAFLGCSLAGYFGLFALLHEPGLFRRYIIGSPWTDPGDMSIFQFETEYASRQSDLPADVFLGAGALEPEFVLNNLLRLEKVLRNRNYPGLHIQRHLFEGETHLSAIPLNITKGLRTLYK